MPAAPGMFFAISTGLPGMKSQGWRGKRRAEKTSNPGRARHVLSDQHGIAGNELAEMAREETRVDIIDSARRGADGDRDRLALVEILGVRGCAGQDHRAEKQ